MKKYLPIILVALVVALGAYAAWYTYHRHEVIVQLDKCDYALTHPEASPKMRAPDGTFVPVMTPCLMQPVPPSIGDLVRGHVTITGIPESMKVAPYSFWDVLLGRYALNLNLGAPCNQSATTTDCSTLSSLPQSAPPPYVPPNPVQPVETWTSATGSAFVSVGDVLGAMTVVSVKSFNTGQYSSDPKMMQLGPQNIQANLKGPIEVTGAYSAVHDGIGFDGYCMSVSDVASLARLPALPVSSGSPAFRSYFCFRDGETVKQKLGEASRTITVTIDNYQLNSYPAEVMDWADLISVVRE